MAKKIRKRIPDVKTLYEILPPKKPSSGNEFARIVNLLLFHKGRRCGANVTLFDDRAGDWRGLDAFEKQGKSIIGYQHKFYPSPLTEKHRYDLEDSLKTALNACKEQKIKLKKWILVTPQDFVESATRKTGGDVTWFEKLKDKFTLPFEIEHWGHTQLISLFLESPAIGLFYYPELFPGGSGRKKTIQDFRARYDKAFAAQYEYIELVGMAVYKEAASRPVPMQKIYIPLTTIPSTADDYDPNVSRHNPLEFLKPGSHHVVLGDPGSGKTTMLKFLSLAGQSKALRKRYNTKPDDRLPVLVL